MSQTVKAGADAAAEVRPNEKWWQRNGGLSWQRELDSRRLAQPHYGQQEAFLRGLFMGMPQVRALDFGCGYGRHLNYLRTIPGLDIHGCDMSPTMLEGAAAYLNEPLFVDRHVHRIQPRARLPFPDGHFDVVFTSEVLIHVAPEDLELLLPEMWRVSSKMVLHIENRPVDGSRRENDAHSGCWLHDFREVYRRRFGLELEVLPQVIDRQCVYIARHAAAEAGGAGHGRQTIADLEHALKAERELTWSLRNRLMEFEARGAPPSGPSKPPVVDRVRRRIAPILGWPQPQLPGPVAPPELSFAGVATRASRSTVREFVADQPKTVAICHPAWRGIRAAAYGQVEHVLEVPGITSPQHAERLVNFLGDCGTEKVVINGYPPEIDLLPEAISRLAPRMQTYFVYHGAPAAAAHEMHLLQRMLDLSREGKVARIGLLKDGLAEFFSRQGYPAVSVMNIARMPVLPVRQKPADAPPEIGIFAPTVIHKNVETQVMAAMMVPNSIVHIAEAPPLPFIDPNDPRLRVHGILPHHEFMSLLSTMHASLTVSLVECYPMTVLESFFSGVLCLTSHTSVIFDRSPELFDALVVTAHDSPAAVARKLVAGLERREELVEKAQKYLLDLNVVAEKRFREFLFE